MGSKTLKTNEVKVKVLKDDKRKSTGTKQGEEIFVELEISDSVAYVGQQVLLKYVIYTSVDVRSYNFVNESEYTGFYVEELQNFREKAIKVVRDGRQYVKQTLKVVSLFPQQTGKAEIGSALINLGIAVKSERPSFFFSTSMRSKRLATPVVKVDILSAPPNAPGSFSGAVGDYKMSCGIDRTSVSLDGAVTITMNIVGDGDAKFVSPPKQIFDGFEIYDPNLLYENDKIVDGRITTTKGYEYLLVPENKGIFRIRPEFSFLSIDSNKYITLYGPQYPIRIAGGNRNQIVSTEDIDARLAPIATSTELYKISDPIFSAGHIGFLSFCAFTFLIIGGIKMRKDQQAKIDPSILRSRRAQKIAIQKLATSKKHLDNQMIKDFYSSLSDNLFSYLSHKLDVPVAQISKDNMKELFNGHLLSEDKSSALANMIERSEMAIYAGFTPENAAEDYESSKQLIMDIEDALKN